MKFWENSLLWMLVSSVKNSVGMVLQIRSTNAWWKQLTI